MMEAAKADAKNKKEMFDMQLGEVIRKYRKSKNMTQEEMAVRLGVTAPAVNKWENGNSFPDIMLLAPIARLLGISLDTLLSFRDTLTVEEINQIIYEMDAMFKEKSYDEVFEWAEEKLTKYPNCEQLILSIAVVLDAQRMVQELPDSDKYDAYLCSLYVRALESGDEDIRVRAADSLVGFYRRKKQYDKAEQYLEYFSKQNPVRKYLQAEIFAETGLMQEAYRAYEELLFADYQRASGTLWGMYKLALEEDNMELAHMLVDRQAELAGCFGMGRYHEVSCRLELATLEQDADAVIGIMKEMLSSIEQISSFRNSPLYTHMEFKEPREAFIAELKKNLLDSFRDEETFGFLACDSRWQALIRD